jgi:hypothetical protein
LAPVESLGSFLPDGDSLNVEFNETQEEFNEEYEYKEILASSSLIAD